MVSSVLAIIKVRPAFGALLVAENMSQINSTPFDPDQNTGTWKIGELCGSENYPQFSGTVALRQGVRIVQGRRATMKSATLRMVVAVAAFGLIGPGWSMDVKELLEDLRQVRDVIRKFRGKKPAPQPPAPPESVQTPGAGPAKGMTFKGNCVGKEATGYAENAQILVALGEVRTLEARVDIPKRGSCRFHLKDFRQTQESPIVELLSQSNSGCSVRIWQQQDRVTMVATDCPEKCTGGSFEYLWPIEFRTPEGSCY
jgi:hypothetical protein